MSTITRSDLPPHALLGLYVDKGAYTDCYSMDVAFPAGLDDYLFSFYTSPVFKVERMLLGLVARKPATDQDAQALALGSVARFSAWDVEDRHADQILLRDFLGRTRSWLMVAPSPVHPGGVRLYFGSAVLPKNRTSDGAPAFGALFHVGARFHHGYTIALMRSALARLRQALPGASLRGRTM
jgi:hypothetical protein